MNQERSTNQVDGDTTCLVKKLRHASLTAAQSESIANAGGLAKVLDRNDSGRLGDPFAGCQVWRDDAPEEDHVTGRHPLHVWRDGRFDVEDDEVCVTGVGGA